MDSGTIKILEWIICDGGKYIDEQEQIKSYELVAKEVGNDKKDGPYDLSEVYIMRINSDHLPLWDFPTSKFFGKELVWKCNMDLFETKQEKIDNDYFLKGGIADVYYPKAGVKLSDIFVFDTY